MRQINRIIIHMSYTPPSMDIGAARIREWHGERGFKDVGYHFVIRRNGVVENGRPVEQQGAHTLGQNVDSIGIVLIGGKKENENDWECNYTSCQWRALDRLCRDLIVKYKITDISGHKDWAARGCPGFNAREWAVPLLR
jgi:N-acetyl-anhydromuramyl-L-alanine amidase AmpD